MVELAAGHQVHCILWEQVAISNKGICCYMDYIFALNIFCEEYLQAMFDVANMLIRFTVKDFPMNAFDLWASKYTGLFIFLCLEQGLRTISSVKL